MQRPVLLGSCPPPRACEWEGLASDRKEESIVLVMATFGKTPLPEQSRAEQSALLVGDSELP